MATVNDEIGRLDGLPVFELRTLWRRLWKQPPPMRLSRDMLIRGLAWKLQEIAVGGLGKVELRKLAALAKLAVAERSAQQTVDSAEESCANDSQGKAESASTADRLRQASRPSAPVITLREGNRLVREWNGTTHHVLVLASGFEWQGRQYRSLSQIAEAITGAHWSGPRFFGLTNRKGQGRGSRGETAGGRPENDKATVHNIADSRVADENAAGGNPVTSKSTGAIVGVKLANDALSIEAGAKSSKTGFERGQL